MIQAEILQNNTILIKENAVSDSVRFETVKFKLPKTWEAYAKTAVFTYGDDVVLNILLDEANELCIGADECYIPYEVLKYPGFGLSVFGVSGESIATTPRTFVKVLQSGYAEGDAPGEPTPTEYQQLIAISEETKQIAQSVRDDADNGLFKGEKGDKGEVTLDYANNTFAPVIRCNSKGSIVAVNDASPIEHKLDIKLSAVNLWSYGNVEADRTTDTRVQEITLEIPAGAYKFSCSYTQNRTVVPIGVTCYATEGSATYGMKTDSLASGTLAFTFTIPAGKSGCRLIFYSNIYSDVIATDDACSYSDIKIISADLSGITVTRCGKNLIPDFRADAASLSYTGITFTNNADGSITANGTAAYGCYYWFTGQNAFLLPAGTYTFYPRLEGGNTSTYYVSFHYGSGAVYVDSSSKTFTVTEPTLCGVCFSIVKGQTVNNLTIYPQLEIGTVATEYEQYKALSSVSDNNGIVEGLTSISPNITLIADSEVTETELAYNADTKLYIDNIIARL